jgi:hypothetical protein
MLKDDAVQTVRSDDFNGGSLRVAIIGDQMAQPE